MFAILIPHLAPNPFKNISEVKISHRLEAPFLFSCFLFVWWYGISLNSNALFQKQDYGFSFNAIQLI